MVEYWYEWIWMLISNFKLTTQIKANEQLVVRKDMDVNEHELLSNFKLKT